MNFISLGNELKPEQRVHLAKVDAYFISLGNELKPEHLQMYGGEWLKFYIVRKRA